MSYILCKYFKFWIRTQIAQSDTNISLQHINVKEIHFVENIYTPKENVLMTAVRESLALTPSL